MTVTRFTRGLDELSTRVLLDGRHRRVLGVAGTLNYYTAERLTEAYHTLREREGRGLRRLVLDLRRVEAFDATGAAALLELARDADSRAFDFLIADRPDRPAYIATGLRERLRFLAETEIEELPMHGGFPVPTGKES